MLSSPLLASLATHASDLPVLAGRGRLISKLIEGDPVAWAITGGIAAIWIGVAVFKNRAAANNNDDQPNTPS